MTRILALAVLLLGAVLATAPAGAAESNLRIGYARSLAYGPFFVARDKGFFADAGVAVEMIPMDDASVRAAALRAGRIDATALTIDALPIYLTPEVPLAYVFALASSRGGDGLIARADIETIADLKGRVVAMRRGGPAEFFVSVLLDAAGMSLADITIVDLEAGDAGDAFVEGRVDAAMTWEPWLTRAKAGGAAHVLVDSASQPGLLTDMLVARTGTVNERKKDFRALYRGWIRAVRFIAENPDESRAIMARGIGGWLRNPKIVGDMQAGVAFHDVATNAMFFGTPTAPGLLEDTVQRALDIWGGFGKLRVVVEADDLISYAVVQP